MKGLEAQQAMTAAKAKGYNLLTEEVKQRAASSDSSSPAGAHASIDSALLDKLVGRRHLHL